MKKEKYIDLSDIKSQENLDKTASFVDLMSRQERNNHEQKKKEKEQKELQEILFKEEKNIVKNKKKDRKRKEQLEKITKEEIQPKLKKDNFKSIDSNDLTNTQRIMNFTNDLTSSVLDNVQTNIDISKKKQKYGISNILIIGLMIIASLVFYIYSILFTTIQSDETQLLIGGVIILSMITLFCISIVCGKILYRILSVLNYLIIIGYIIFNIIVIIGIKM